MRTFALVVSALAVGASAGRQLLRKRVEYTKSAAISDALGQARQEIATEAEAYIARSLSVFGRRLAIKALVLGSAAIALYLVSPGPMIVSGVLATLIGGLLVWDIIVSWPSMRMIAGHVRRNGINPKAVIASAVSANVFASVLKRALTQRVSRTETLLLFAAGTSADQVKTDIAEAVATLAGEASWADLKPFLLLASGKVAVLFLLYSIFVWGMFLTLPNV